MCQGGVNWTSMKDRINSTLTCIWFTSSRPKKYKTRQNKGNSSKFGHRLNPENRSAKWRAGPWRMMVEHPDCNSFLCMNHESKSSFVEWWDKIFEGRRVDIRRMDMKVYLHEIVSISSFCGREAWWWGTMFSDGSLLFSSPSWAWYSP